MLSIHDTLFLIVATAATLFFLYIHHRSMADIIIYHLSLAQTKSPTPPRKIIYFTIFFVTTFQAAHIVLMLFLLTINVISKPSLILPLLGLLIIIPTGIYKVMLRYPYRHGFWTSILNLFLVSLCCISVPIMMEIIKSVLKHVI